MESTWYYESKLAKKIGIPRGEFLAARRICLKKNPREWQMRGRELLISPRGLLRVLAFLRKKTGARFDDINFVSCAVPQQLNGASKQPSFTRAQELTVKRIYPNEHLLLVTQSTGQELRVWVPSNANFRPKMKLKARPQEDAKRPWRLVGRCPRYVGRW